jgi:Flagellar hook-length control protein FliK
MMDTQPLLRVSNIKPQSNPSTATRDSDSNDFGQHLQDQIQQAETAGPAEKSINKGAKQNETQSTQSVSDEPQEAGMVEASANEDVVAVMPDVDVAATDSAEMLMNLLAITDAGTGQGLPQDGNALPLMLADLLTSPDVTQAENIVPMLTTDLANKNPATTIADKASGVLAQFDVSDMIQPAENETAILEFQVATEDSVNIKNMSLPEMKLQLKSDDVMSDKQFAALITDANRNVAAAMQQVQAITGSAAANIQSYVPPQFTAAQTATSIFNGSINIPVNHPAWGNQVGDQLVFMLQGKLQSAEIKLNPAHLGPMEIRLSMHEDKASVTFISAHAPVREALDAALPRLREMMEQQGLNLTNVDVSAHSGGQQQAFEQQNSQSRVPAFDDQQSESAEPATVIKTRIETGLSVFV